MTDCGEYISNELASAYFELKYSIDIEDSGDTSAATTGRVFETTANTVVLTDESSDATFSPNSSDMPMGDDAVGMDVKLNFCVGLVVYVVFAVFEMYL